MCQVDFDLSLSNLYPKIYRTHTCHIQISVRSEHACMHLRTKPVIARFPIQTKSILIFAFSISGHHALFFLSSTITKLKIVAILMYSYVRHISEEVSCFTIISSLGIYFFTVRVSLHTCEKSLRIPFVIISAILILFSFIIFIDLCFKACYKPISCVFIIW